MSSSLLYRNLVHEEFSIIYGKQYRSDMEEMHAPDQSNVKVTSHINQIATSSRYASYWATRAALQITCGQTTWSRSMLRIPRGT